MTKRTHTQKSRDPDLLTRLARDIVLAGRLIFDRRVSGTAKLIPLVITAYIISPIDLVPDIFLPFGILDDFTAFFVGLQLFIHSAPPGVVDGYRQGRARGKIKRGADPAANVPNNRAPMIIDGEYEVHDNRD